MNNLLIAGLLVTLLFVVLASVCAFPFYNCAKKEKFSMANARDVANKFCSDRVAASVYVRNEKDKSTASNHDCLEWSKDYILKPNTINAYFKAGNKFGNGVKYQVMFKDKYGKPIARIESVNGEVTTPANVLSTATRYWLTRVYPPKGNGPMFPPRPMPPPPK